MDQLNSIELRNKLIILFLICIVILHLIFMTIFTTFKELPIIVGVLVYSFILLRWLKTRKSPLLLGFFSVIGCNVYVFSVNLMTPDQVHLMYWIFPIMLASLYNIIWLNIFVTGLTAIEFVILLSLPNSNYFSADPGNTLVHNVAILVVIFILCLMFIIILGGEWKRISFENVRLDTIVASKAGYLELFFKHANDGIAVFGLDGKILVVNPAFERMYGWKQDECIGKSPRFYPPSQDEEASKRTAGVLKGESFHDIRTKEMTKSGKTFDAELTIAPIYNDRNDIIAISFISRDITHKLQTEKLLLDSEKLKGMGQIAASVAHEVRNPLTSISGFIQLMMNDPANPYPSYTEIIFNEMQRIDLIVGEFLVLSKPSLQLTNDFYIEETIQTVIEMFEPETTDCSIGIHLQQPKKSVKICGNEYGLKQVFINLLKNAREALVENGLITFKTFYKDDIVTIIISDNGPGMDDETISNLFEPFYTTKPEGTGLGMMISKKIVVDHNGTIDVVSEKDVGTEITIKLPIVPLKNA